MSPRRAERVAFMAEAHNQLGKPYIWGAKGPDTFDCSGLVTHSLRAAGGPDLRATHNAQHLADDCKAAGTLTLVDHHAELPEPLPGTLAFYGVGPNLITHVMICWGDGRVLGASGGGKDTTTPKKNAEVKFKDSPLYRFDLVAYGELPYLINTEKTS